MLSKLFPKIALLALTAGSLSFYSGASANGASPGFVSLHGYAARGNHVRLGQANAAQSLSIVVALKPRNEAGLKALIQAMHDPSSPQFGHYLTPAQFSDQFSPSAADYEAVAKHFEGQGLTVSRRSSRMILKITGTTAHVAKTFGTSFSRYAGSDGEFVAADADPQLPADVAGHVAAVVGLRTNVRLKPSLVISSAAHSVSSATTGPNGGLAPQDIQKAYDIPSLLGGGSGETIGLMELDGYDPADIKVYAKKFGLPPLKLQNVFIDGFPGGSTDPFSGQVEVTLDLEMIQAVAPLAKVQVYQGYNNDLPTVLDIYDRIISDNTAKEISTSWGNPEDLLLGTPGGSDFLQAENYLFEEAAAQGQSVFAASADRGAFDDGSMPTTPVVDDPASQPYVIGVGGTSLHTGAFGQWTGENTWNTLATTGNATGGGVSRFWPITATQLPAATAAGVSTAYRNVPDVALNADINPGYSVYQASNAVNSANGDGWFLSGGTSAAAPLWAAFMATVNSDRRAIGLKRLGWPAPALYSLYKSPLYGLFFHDIADGGNNGFYNTLTGYDLTTGLGSINGIGLTAGLLLSPPATVTVGAQPTTPVLLAQGGDTKDFLSWSAVPHATSYKVYRSIGSDPTLHFLATVFTNTYVDSGVTDDTTYNYAVAAVGSWGVGSLSATQSATPTALFFELPPISGFAAPGVLQIFWISSTNGSNTVTYGYTPTTLNHTVNCQFGNGGFITLTGLTPNVPVYFDVTVNAGNGVLDSGVQEATP